VSVKGDQGEDDFMALNYMNMGWLRVGRIFFRGGSPLVTQVVSATYSVVRPLWLMAWKPAWWVVPRLPLASASGRGRRGGAMV
jgi:hypothetical protein